MTSTTHGPSTLAPVVRVITPYSSLSLYSCLLFLPTGCKSRKDASRKLSFVLLVLCESFSLHLGVRDTPLNSTFGIRKLICNQYKAQKLNFTTLSQRWRWRCSEWGYGIHWCFLLFFLLLRISFPLTANHRTPHPLLYQEWTHVPAWTIRKT